MGTTPAVTPADTAAVTPAVTPAVTLPGQRQNTAGNVLIGCLQRCTFDDVTPSQGLLLHTRQWLLRGSKKPKGLVFLTHGYGEHIGRYEHVAAALNAAGLAVFGLDNQGACVCVRVRVRVHARVCI